MPLYFHEMRAFRPSGLKTLNSSTLADFSGLIRIRGESHAADGAREDETEQAQRHIPTDEGTTNGSPSLIDVFDRSRPIAAYRDRFAIIKCSPISVVGTAFG